MSLLLLLRRVTKVFRPNKPVRGASVRTSPEMMWVVRGVVRDTVHFSEVNVAVKLSPTTQPVVVKTNDVVVSN